MRKRCPARVLGTALFALSLAGSAAQAAVPSAKSVKPASPIRLDGRDDDWAGVPRLTDPKSKTELAFQNDGRNLYILMILGKSESVRSAETSGMTVLGRPAGSKAAAKGVLFLNGQINADGFIAWRESQGATMTDQEKILIRLSPRHPIGLAFAVDDKGSAYGPLQKQTAVWPPDFRTDVPEGATVFELRIPLDPPEPIPGGFAGAPGGTLRLTFKWGGPGRKSLSTQASRESPGHNAGYQSGTGRTWGQEFLDTFDAMSRPAATTWQFSFSVDVTLADGN